MPGGAGCDKDLSSRCSPGTFCFVASGPSLVRRIMATSLSCCWEDNTGLGKREPSKVPVSVYGRLLLLKQEVGKTLRLTCLLPWMVLPTAGSQTPRQPLMSSASKAVRQISTQARDLQAWLSPAKCFQLVLGNWCQLLWGELLGTSWAVGRWALDCSRSLAWEPVLPQGAQVAWRQNYWEMVFTWWREVAVGWRPKPLKALSMRIRPHMLLLSLLESKVCWLSDSCFCFSNWQWFFSLVHGRVTQEGFQRCYSTKSRSDLLFWTSDHSTGKGSLELVLFSSPS